MSNCLLSYDELYNSSFFCAIQTACCVTGAAELSGKIELLLDEAASLIKNYLGRDLCVNRYTDKFRGNNRNVFWTRYFPLTGIVSFNYQSVMQSNMCDNFPTQMAVASGNVNGYYLIDDRTGQIEVLNKLSDRQRFTIIYDAGYEIIPDDIKTAMKILTAHLSAQIDSGNLANPDFSIESVKVDTGGFTFGGSKMIKNIVVRSLSELSNLPITVFKILDKYKASKGLGK